MRRHAPLAALLGVCATASLASAHHSYATFFDLCTRITIEGQVERVEWKDPHVWLHVRTDDGTVHRAEWTGPNNLVRNGVRPDSVTAGDRLVVTGSPFRDPAVIRKTVPAFKGEFLDTTVSALTQVRRPIDGWTWARGAQANQPGCSAGTTR